MGNNFKFGGGGETYIHFVVGLALAVVGIFILCLPRRHVVAPVLVAIFLVPMDQVIVVGGLHFTVLRLVILLFWVRVLATKFYLGCEFFNGGINRLDKTVILYVGTSVIAFTLLWQESAAFINHLGLFYNICGSYFAFRFFIRDKEDVERTIRVLGCIVIPIAVIMTIEVLTGWNAYALIGGGAKALRESIMLRGERFRAFASFGHPILAGTFGATLFPLFLGLLLKGGANIGMTLAAAIAASVIVLSSNSSTPLLAYLAGIGALCLWPLRDYMSPIRRGIAIALILLHLTMQAPVWALIQRVDLIAGSSGFHRYYLIDSAIRHFGEWWLLGAKDNSAWGFEMWDLANQYIAIGWDSGLFPLVLFVALIVFGFKYLGRARKACEGNRGQELFLWALGAALFSHVIAFFGASYFDQTIVGWYMFLALISAVAVSTEASGAQAE